MAWATPLCQLGDPLKGQKVYCESEKKFSVSNSIKVCKLQSENDKAVVWEWSNEIDIRPAIIAYYPYQHR